VTFESILSLVWVRPPRHPGVEFSRATAAGPTPGIKCYKELTTRGHTPEAALYSALFTNTRDDRDTIFVTIGDRPVRYFLKAMAGQTTAVTTADTPGDTIAPDLSEYLDDADAHRFSDSRDDEESNIDPIPKGERTLHTQSYDFSIHEIVNKINSGEIVLDPDYQRNYIWDNKRASLLIESVLLNMPIPVIYVAEQDDGWVAGAESSKPRTASPGLRRLSPGHPGTIITAAANRARRLRSA
jgi:hypothetical protein